MRNVETTMAWIFLVERGSAISVTTVTIEVSAISYLAITADTEAFAVYMLHHTICSYCLCARSCKTSNQGSRHQTNS